MNLQFHRILRALGLLTAMLVSSAASAESPAIESTALEADVPVIAPVLEPLEVHKRTSLTVVEQLRHNHFVRKPLDDGISSEMYDKYLDTLDGGRAYFLASDVESFEGYRYSLDDALKRGDLEPAFEIFYGANA
jgi:carboxyl-terminal processing protease